MPFDESSRFVDGLALFGNTKNPPLVVGMTDPGVFMAKLEGLAEGGDQEAVAALTAVEQYQWQQMLAVGMTPSYAAGPLEPVVGSRVNS